PPGSSRFGGIWSRIGTGGSQPGKGECSLEPFRLALVSVSAQLAVGIDGQRDRAVAKLTLDPINRRAVLERDPGEGVAEGVEGAHSPMLTGSWDASSLQCRVEDAPQEVAVGETAEVAVLGPITEHQCAVRRVAVVVPVLEYRERRGRQVDGASLSALR